MPEDSEVPALDARPVSRRSALASWRKGGSGAFPEPCNIRSGMAEGATPRGRGMCPRGEGTGGGSDLLRPLCMKALLTPPP